MKKYILILSVIVFASCRQKGGGDFTVSGTIKNAPSTKVFLQELPYGGTQPVVLDSGTIAPNGSFSLHTQAREEGLYRVLVQEGPDVLIINDSKDIRLTWDVNHYRSYDVDGSPASASMHKLFEDYRRRDSTLYFVFEQIDSLKKLNATDSMMAPLNAKRDAEINSMNSLLRDFIKNSSSPAARFYALNMAFKSMDRDEAIALTNASADKFKEHSGLAKLKSLLAVQKAQQPAKNPLLDQPAPEISMPDVNGQPVQLSSLKGKYVLVDFWASWCGPCRQENPNVVTAYNNFKDKNFTILGVSLDNDKAAWLEAIKNDKLTWTHISDLKQWQSSVVQTYGIEGIPFNVLVDPQGKIIATELRGEELQKKLAEVLK